MVDVPVLTDGSVRLRAHAEDDLDDIVEQSNDPLSRTWTRVPVPYGRDDARRFIREAMPGGWATDEEWGFALEAHHDGEPRFAGTVTLRNQGEGRAEIAYGAHPWARGRGIVGAGLRLLLDWGFAERELTTVIWWAQEGNWASRKAAWRLGFSCDGVVRRWQGHRGELVDAWVGTLHRGEERAPRHPWYDAPTIHGDRLVLRTQRESDAPRILEARRDERSSYWLRGSTRPEDLEDAVAYVRTRQGWMASGTALYWTIADPADDDLLGSVALRGLEDRWDAEIGYWTHPRARGRGVMSAAVGLAVRHAFIDVEDGGLGLGRLRLVSALDNTASRRVAEVNGFREVGIERLGTPCRDGPHDAMVYDLLPGDLNPGVLR